MSETAKASPLPEHENAPLAPAELDRLPRLRERLAWYGGSVLLSFALICGGLRVDRVDLHAPFYYDLDALLYLTMVKATLERGSHWQNERMGAPGVQQLYDFPVIDHLHFTILRLLAACVPDPPAADPDADEPGPSARIRKLLLVYNLYHLLTYPLTVLTAMLALRVLRLSLPAAAVGGLLYAFLPYHQDRWEYHYFLAAYWVVPLSLLPALVACRGELPFYPMKADGTRPRALRSWRAAGLVALAAATASAGAYYAFFACAAYAFAGLYGWAVFRTWRALASAGLLIGLVVGFGVVNHYPTFVYQYRFGKNPVTVRFPEEAEIYGLKLAHLLLPTADHNITWFGELRTRYASPLRPAEAESGGALGLVAAAGLVGLVGLLLLPFPRRWPEGPLAALVVFLLLLGTVGGIGSVFNLLVTAQIRAYNRIGVVIAFVCLFAALWWLDRFLLTRTEPRWKRLRYPAWAFVVLLGFLDQTPYSWFKPRVVETINKQADRFRADARFFARVERAVPGGRIFCLPYAAFPEQPPLHKMAAYEHARGYVLTDSLIWSFGAMKGREADAWQQDVAAPLRKGEIANVLKRLVATGFDGVTIDGRGFPPPRDAREAAAYVSATDVLNESNQAFRKEVGRPTASLPEIAHEDKNQFFLDLRPFRDAYRANNPGAFAALEQQEREWAAPIWLGGFYTPEPIGYGNELRFGPPDGTLVIVNPTDRTRTFRLIMMIGIDSPGVFHFAVSGLDEDAFVIEKEAGSRDGRQFGQMKTYTVEVPPGRHALRIRCTPQPNFVPADHRKLCYFIMNFRMEEVR